MGILTERYGRLGKLNRAAWKHLLNSNQGLFKRAPPNPNIIGPNINRSGRIEGDIMSAEIVYFTQVASKPQYGLLEELFKENPIAAKEYVLTITNSIKLWKEDIKWLKVAFHYLKKEESILKVDEELIIKSEIMKASIKLPPVLKRHFPQLFQNINFEHLDFQKILEKVKEVESQVESEEHYLKDYFKRLEKELPFLFEKN